LRASPLHILVFLLALTLAGCSAAGIPIPQTLGTGNSPATSAVTAGKPTPTVASSPTATATATAASSAATLATPTAAVNSAEAAIKAVIEKANQEQQDAFAKNDPSLMRDTATSSYYNELVQINRDMANHGVSAIKLVKIEWGPITLSGAARAQATTYETWRTTYSDGSTDQSRDRNVYVLVLEQGVWKIQSDDHPDANQGPGSGSPAPSTPRTVPPASPVPSAEADTSHNWSGYAATDGQFTAVTGTWTVPETQSNGSFGSGATWVGIGGVRSRDLIQAGTQQITDGSGTVHYQAWTEILPQASRQVPFTVNPGDSVTVSIGYQGNDQWLISFANNTTGQKYHTTLRYTSSLSSAEWVVEAPSARQGVLPLDNFGSIQFTQGSAVKDGKTVTIAEAGAQPITMVDALGTVLASPSALTSDGKGFTVTRTDAQPVLPRQRRGGGF